MSTEKENWREDSSEDRDAGRDGNRTYNRDGYNRRDDNRSSYNRDSNYNRDNRQSRPSSYGDRPQRSSSYDRPQRTYNRDDNRTGGYNREEGGERPYRPRFNREEGSGENRSERPQRSYNNNYNNRGGGYNSNREGGYNNNREGGGYGNNRGTGYNSNREGGYNSNREGGERPRFRKPNTEGGNSYGGSSYGNRERNSSYGNREGGSSYGNSYGNREGEERQRRPRFTPNSGGGSGRPQGFSRPTRRTDDYNPNAKYSVKKQIEYKEQYTDPNEPVRLNKYLANAGVCSRREADEFITAGVVSVNDVVVTELGTKIKRTDLVKFHDELVNVERKVYILLNKPKDTVTTSDDPQDRRTVMDLVKGACSERIYPVGRLDRNTTGVLLLTNDGDLASKLTHPKFLKKKIYQVTTDNNVTKSDMDKILEGIKLDEETVIKADSVSYTDDYKRNMIGIEIHSGQNRVVRRIFETLGYKVIKLDRVYFAGLTKKGLKRGDWRYLTENEVSYLRMGSFT
ncbi:pseudouridine synthase [Bacteroides sp. OttesenSCG-928-N06]|nr:pseudouridine synthase [Bacteroides sp. OttesenSCG-928-N06]